MSAHSSAHLEAQRRSEREARKANRAARRERKAQRAKRQQTKPNASAHTPTPSRVPWAHQAASSSSSMPQANEHTGGSAAMKQSTREPGASAEHGKSKRRRLDSALTPSSIDAYHSPPLGASLVEFSKNQLKDKATELVKQALRKGRLEPAQLDVTRLIPSLKGNESREERKQHTKLAKYVARRLEKENTKKGTRGKSAPKDITPRLMSSASVPSLAPTPAAPAPASAAAQAPSSSSSRSSNPFLRAPQRPRKDFHASHLPPSFGSGSVAHRADRTETHPRAGSALSSPRTITGLAGGPLPPSAAAAHPNRAPLAVEANTFGRSVGVGMSALGTSTAEKRWARAKSGPRNKGNQRQNKEALITANVGCSHLDMLQKLYMPKQLKWLQEEYGLEWKASQFSKAEDALLEEGVREFARNNDMSVDAAKGLFNDRPTPEHAILYADLTSHLVRKLGNRPARNLRVHCTTLWDPDKSVSGKWSAQEVESLMQSYDQHGPYWERIGSELNRPGHACRSRYTFELSRQMSTKGHWSESETTELLRLVQEYCEEVGIVPADIPKGDKRFSWTVIGKRIGSRSAHMCRDKWCQIFCRLERIKRGQPSKWTTRDDFILLQAIKGESQAIEENDEILFDWRKMPTYDWFWDIRTIRHHWYCLRKRHASQAATIKDALDIITAAVTTPPEKRQSQTDARDTQHRSTTSKSSAPQKEATSARKRKKTQSHVDDLIDTDEEE